MAGPALLALRLPPGAPLSRAGLARLLAPLRLASLAPLFALSSREEAFVREVRRRKSNLHLWRCHQGAACGDFVAVDMAEAEPARRVAVVIELKRGARLKVGGRDHQLRNAQAVVDELAAAGIVGPASAPLVVLGDREEVAAWLGL